MRSGGAMAKRSSKKSKDGADATKSVRPGRAFERAVYEFAAALAPDAKVIFDHRVPDVETGALRQVDVWIEGLLQGHWPFTILVSCKDHRRRLDIEELEAFFEQIRATGAQTGVIYSRKGFTKNALKKAQKRGVSCCRFYDNEPPDLPELVFVEEYLAMPTFRLIGPGQDERGGRKTWGELLACVVELPNRTLRDLLDELFYQMQTESLQVMGGSGFPEPRMKKLDVSPEDGSAPFSVILNLGLIWYHARREAHRVSGSYCVSAPSFSGSIAGPAIDLNTGQPSDGWEPVDGPPTVRTTPFVVIAPRRRTLEGLMPPGLESQEFDQSPTS
jgi:hypothetical protein